MKRHVALVGFMGSGKTTVGPRLAHRLAVEFTDTDARIVERHGPIEQLFAERGERSFRALERAAVKDAFDAAPGVVSLGGGALTYGPTRVLVASKSVRVYLRASPQTLLRRLQRSRTPRPVLGERPTLSRIEALLELREPYYRSAEIVVRVDGRTPASIASELAARLARRRGLWP